MDAIEPFTMADIEATNLLREAGMVPLATDKHISFCDCGNFIIALAERIKAERLIVAMKRRNDYEQNQS